MTLRPRFGWSATLFAITGCGLDTNQGPNTVVIASGPACEECAIVVEEVAILGHADDPSSIRPDPGPCVVGQLSTGEFIGSGLIGGGQLFVYDSSGRVVRRIAREGEGPGELMGNQRVIVGPMDSLFVMSWTRLVAFDPTGRHIESLSFRIPWTYWSFARLRDGGFVFHTPAPTSDGPTVRVLDASGVQVGAHGNPAAHLIERQMPDLDYRTVNPAVSGAYWTSKFWSYEMTRWSTPGVRDLTIVRQADWFPPNEPASWEEMDAWHVETPPPRTLFHIREDAEGLLWTYTLIPDEHWNPEPEPDRINPGWIERTFDTKIEVIDMQGRTVLAEYRHDEKLIPVCGRSLMTSVRETPTGDTRAVVFSPSLQRQSGP